MKIERATAKDLDELKMLWSIVFQEDPMFLERFFSQRFQPEHVFVARKEGEIVSALHALPSSYIQGNTEKRCAFIVGAATYASHRKQGIMGELLAYTKASTPYPITLFPAVRPFYEANAYITTSSMEEYWITQKEEEEEKEQQNQSSRFSGEKPLSAAALDRIYREATKEKGALLRDELGWNFLIDGYELTSVQDAYAFIKEGIAVEAMAVSEEAARELLSLLKSKQTAKLRVIPNSPFASLLQGPYVQIPMGMSTDESMRGVYIAEQY
ncbi:MAG: GNAT family N-acetyltransferase [Sphaerochaeta sp.]|nr:GNAT family N-acetyltransferase [Sphaerochaeta sp.]